MPWGVAAAAVGAVGSIAGSEISSSAAKDAANTSAQASNYAAQLAQQRYDITRNDLLPYNTTGQSTLSSLIPITQTNNDNLNTAYDQAQNAYNTAQSYIPGAMTQAELEKTPGYQFNLSQGLKAVQSSAAMKGLGISSPAMQAAATYATGLADSTYQNQFDQKQKIYSDYNNQFGNAGTLFNLRGTQGSNLYNQTRSIASLGESAAAQTGDTGANLANTQATAIQAAGNAQAAGTLGSANALSGGFNGVSNALTKYFNQQTPSTNSTGYSSGSSYTGGTDGSAASNYGTQAVGANELQSMGWYNPVT